MLAGRIECEQSAHVQPHGVNGRSIKKAKIGGLRPEYVREDLGKGIRGRYYREYQEGTNLVLLDPDVAAVFPTEDSVNRILRSLIDVAQRSTGLKHRSAGGAKKRRSG